jgi:5-methylthioribose kinase
MRAMNKKTRFLRSDHNKEKSEITRAENHMNKVLKFLKKEKLANTRIEIHHRRVLGSHNKKELGIIKTFNKGDGFERIEQEKTRDGSKGMS